jgi:hypothetical protein
LIKLWSSTTRLPQTYNPQGDINKFITSFITKAENRYPLSKKIAYKNIIHTMDKACKDFNFCVKTSENMWKELGSNL